MTDNLYDTYVDYFCRENIKRDHKVFDCGCGDGQKTNIVTKYSNDVVGGDFEDRTENKNFKFRKITEDNYGSKGEFDVVISLDVIEHVEKDKVFLGRVMEVTKPGGVVILGTPNKDRLSNKVISLFRGEIKYPRNLGYHYESGGDIIHLREYTADELQKVIKELSSVDGFRIYNSFLGLYTPFGPIGFKQIDVKRFREYAQHLFVVIKKEGSKGAP